MRLRYSPLVRLHRGTLLSLIAVVLGVARPASAGLSARLVYLRSGTAESCPDQAALKKAVARRLGYDPFLLAAPHMIVAEMSGSGGRLQARARLLDEAGIVLGSRELLGKSTDCAELLSSLALAISLTLDPMAVVNDVDPEATEEPVALSEKPQKIVAPEPNPRPTPQRTEALATPAQTKRQASLDLHAASIGSYGWVPALSPAVGVGLALRQRSWSLGFDGVAVLAQSQASPDGSKANVSVAYAALTPCLWVGTAAGCALATLGRYSGRGEGVDAPRAGSHLHASTGGRLQGMIGLSARWSIGMLVDGVRVLTRPQFLVAGREVYRPTKWAANLGLFVNWQLL